MPTYTKAISSFAILARSFAPACWATYALGSDIGAAAIAPLEMAAAISGMPPI
jgi:hypothetical protein